MPDFVVCLDAQNMDKTLGGLEPLFEKVNAIVDVRVDNSVMNKGFNKIFVNFSDTDFFIKKLAKYNKYMEFYESGGSASTLALVSAIKMGFSKVVLAGVDLAFKENVIYTDGEVMQRVSQEEIIVDNVKKNLIQVKSVKGDMVYTREDYAAFIQHLATIVKDLNYSEVYNISSFGAAIEGVKNITFEDLNLYLKSNLQAVAFVQPFKFEVKEFIDEEFKVINNVINQLSKSSFSTALVNEILKSV